MLQYFTPVRGLGRTEVESRSRAFTGVERMAYQHLATERFTHVMHGMSYTSPVPPEIPMASTEVPPLQRAFEIVAGTEITGQANDNWHSVPNRLIPIEEQESPYSRGNFLPVDSAMRTLPDDIPEAQEINPKLVTYRQSLGQRFQGTGLREIRDYTRWREQVSLAKANDNAVARTATTILDSVRSEPTASQSSMGYRSQASSLPSATALVRSFGAHSNSPNVLSGHFPRYGGQSSPSLGDPYDSQRPSDSGSTQQLQATVIYAAGTQDSSSQQSHADSSNANITYPFQGNQEANRLMDDRKRAGEEQRIDASQGDITRSEVSPVPSSVNSSPDVARTRNFEITDDLQQDMDTANDQQPQPLFTPAQQLELSNVAPGAPNPQRTLVDPGIPPKHMPTLPKDMFDH
jgi:hypothetical protein